MTRGYYLLNTYYYILHLHILLRNQIMVHDTKWSINNLIFKVQNKIIGDNDK